MGMGQRRGVRIRVSGFAGLHFFCAILFALALVAGSNGMGQASAGIQGSSQPRTDAGSRTLIVPGLGNGTAALDGTWQFHLGDDLAWAAPSLDDSQWEPIRADKPWGAQTHYGYTGFAWYRRHIDFVPVPGTAPDLGLFLPPVQDACEIYWNGVLVGQVGKLPPHPVWYYPSPPTHTFLLGRSRSGVLAIRVWKAPYASFEAGDVGGFTAPPLAGGPAVIAAYKTQRDYRWLHSRQYYFGLRLLYGMTAIVGLLAWLRNRNEKLLLWFAINSLVPLAVMVLTGLRIPFSAGFALGWLQPVLSIGDISLWYLLLYLLQLDDRSALRRWTRSLAWISILAMSLDGTLSFVDWSGPHGRLLQFADAALTAIFTIVEVWPLVLIPFALQKELPLPRWLVAIFVFAYQMLLIVRTASEQGQRFTHWSLDSLINGPLFTIDGNPFNILAVLSTLLFLSIVYAVYRSIAEQGERQVRLEQELQSAQELQRVLVPEVLPALEGYAVTSAYQPAQQVGGDFFQLIAQSDGSALLVIGDVSGKGLKAAMTVSLIVGAIRTLAESVDDPAEILARLNRRMHGRLRHGFVTCLALRLDTEGGCVLANAGHCPPFLNDQEMALANALPLGLVPSASYETTAIQLGAGDRLTLYTDGLLEARNPARSGSREIFGFTRLRELISTRPDARKAVDAAVAFGQDDDITVLTLTRLAVGEAPSTLLSVPELATA
jgi:hypothetical protein